MDYIEWNYIQARRQADKLDDQAESLGRLASDKMAGTLQAIASNWKGENSNAYLCKGEKMQRELDALARELRRTAGVIRSSAERTYRAEMRARELARKRSY